MGIRVAMLNSFNNMKKNWSSHSIRCNIKFGLVLTTHENEWVRRMFLTQPHFQKCEGV
jgi:hypothetical protein